MSDTLLLVVIFLMLLVGALEKLFPQKLNMCKILLCIISLILTIISFLTAMFIFLLYFLRMF